MQLDIDGDEDGDLHYYVAGWLIACSLAVMAPTHSDTDLGRVDLSPSRTDRITLGGSHRSLA